MFDKQRSEIFFYQFQVTPIQFTTGKVAPERSTWIGNDNTPATADRRRQVDIIMADVPTKFHGNSLIDTGHNQYIQFDATNDLKDAMQGRNSDKLKLFSRRPKY
jgi:hypothetical protein